MSSFEKVKSYIADLNYEIKSEVPEEEIIVIDEESQGIKNLVIDCEAPIVILEQYILKIAQPNLDIFKRILQINRELVHGAFVLDETGDKLIFRDTLQLENLDLNELEASIHALSLSLAEYSAELIEFSK